MQPAGRPAPAHPAGARLTAGLRPRRRPPAARRRAPARPPRASGPGSQTPCRPRGAAAQAGRGRARAGSGWVESRRGSACAVQGRCAGVRGPCRCARTSCSAPKVERSPRLKDLCFRLQERVGRQAMEHGLGGARADEGGRTATALHPAAATADPPRRTCSGRIHSPCRSWCGAGARWWALETPRSAQRPCLRGEVPGGCCAGRCREAAAASAIASAGCRGSDGAPPARFGAGWGDSGRLAGVRRACAGSMICVQA